MRWDYLRCGRVEEKYDGWIKDHLDIPDMGVMNIMLPWITRVFLSF